jgi:hypothetical protein
MVTFDNVSGTQLMHFRSSFLSVIGLMLAAPIVPAVAAEQVSQTTRAAESTPAVRVMSSAELKQLRKYCGKRANREDLRCVQLSRLDSAQGKGKGVSPWLIGVPLGLAAGVGAAIGGGGSPASP